MQTILVTGGTGFIGSHTCVELLEAGYNVVILDNLINSKKASADRIEEITGKKVKFYKADLLNIEETRQVFEENNIDITTVLLSDGFEYLPNACDFIIQNDSKITG